jgi:hypothetical protein
VTLTPLINKKWAIAITVISAPPASPPPQGPEASEILDVPIVTFQ